VVARGGGAEEARAGEEDGDGDEDEDGEEGGGRVDERG